MSYTMYTPLNVWLDPASITDVVAYIQTYLSENTIYSETEIETIIHDYLIAHPELIGGVQSVNGKTGTVVLSASDINTANNVTIESVLASLSSQISSIASSVATNTANITNLTGRMTTAETDLTNLKSNLDDKMDAILDCFKNVNFTSIEGSYSYNKLKSLIEGTYIFFDYIAYDSDAQSQNGIMVTCPQSSSYSIETNVYYTSQTYGSFAPIMGNRYVGTKYFGLYVRPTDGLVGYWWDQTDTTNRNIHMNANTINNVIFKPKGKSQTLPDYATITINGTEYSTGSQSEDVEFPVYLGLFSPSNTATTFSQNIEPIGQRIGETIIRDENDNIILDLKPAYDGQNYGFLDVVSYTFYYNENGSFIGGNWQ